MTADTLTDEIVALVADQPGLTLAKIAKRLRADAGAVRQTLAFLVREHYVAQTGKGGRETYQQADS